MKNKSVNPSEPAQPTSHSHHSHNHLADLNQTEITQHSEQQVTPHVHSEESLRQIINRLSRIEGHIRGIKTMIKESRPCPEVLIQIAAVRGGLDRVARIILDDHLTECISRAAVEGNMELEIEQLKSALDRFLG